MTLHDFLALNHRFGWGGHGVAHYADSVGGIYNDCITFLATWVHDQTGIDVARGFRGTYYDKTGAEAIIAAHGGLVPLVERQLSEVAARRVQAPAPGDIGVIVAPGGTSEQTQIGAICFGPVWAFITPGRVVAKQARCLAAWSIPTCA